jgi:hypothetical protein
MAGGRGGLANLRWKSPPFESWGALGRAWWVAAPESAALGLLTDRSTITPVAGLCHVRFIGTRVRYDGRPAWQLLDLPAYPCLPL